MRGLANWREAAVALAVRRILRRGWRSGVVESAELDPSLQTNQKKNENPKTEKKMIPQCITRRSVQLALLVLVHRCKTVSTHSSFLSLSLSLGFFVCFETDRCFSLSKNNSNNHCNSKGYCIYIDFYPSLSLSLYG